MQIPTNPLREDKEEWEGLSGRAEAARNPRCQSALGMVSRSSFTVYKPSPDSVHPFILLLSELCTNRLKKTALAPTYADHTSGALEV